MKKITMVTGILALAFNVTAHAEKMPFEVYEADSLRIVLSDDGTGTIDDVSCRTCDFRSVRITARSKAAIDGKEVNILRARERLGKPAMVSFNPKTGEVQYIRWIE